MPRYTAMCYGVPHVCCGVQTPYKDNHRYLRLCAYVCVCVCVACSYLEEGWSLCQDACYLTQEQYDRAWEKLISMPLELACKPGYLAHGAVSVWAFTQRLIWYTHSTLTYGLTVLHAACSSVLCYRMCGRI